MTYLIISILIFNIIAFFIPKRLTRKEMYTTSIFAMFFQLSLETFLSLKYHYYGYFEKGIQYKTLLVIFGIFPALNIIYLNFFPFHSRFIKKVFYILFWVIFSLAFEWGSIESGYFYYNKWKLWYSALCYPVIYIILLWNYKLSKCDR